MKYKEIEVSSVVRVDVDDERDNIINMLVLVVVEFLLVVWQIRFNLCQKINENSGKNSYPVRQDPRAEDWR